MNYITIFSKVYIYVVYICLLVRLLGHHVGNPLGICASKQLAYIFRRVLDGLVSREIGDLKSEVVNLGWWSW